jgi:hypothetical protein
MIVSEERINELLDQMINNADEDGWCYIPEGLSDDEGDALTKRLTIITMQDKIETLMEGILNTLIFMGDIKEHIDDYEIIDILRIKGALYTIKEDSETILIDLHSEDKINGFFKIDLVIGDDENVEEVSKNAKKMMDELIDTEFGESIEDIKKYCLNMIEIANELIDLLNEKK